MVWLPDRAVISSAFRPLAAKPEMRAERLANGAGRSLFAALWLAVLASLLTSGTVQEGPPSYKWKPFLWPSNHVKDIKIVC